MLRAKKEKGIITKCLHCHKDFLVWPSRLRRSHGKFCSKVCYVAAHHVNNATCPICNKAFHKGTQSQRFCSPLCRTKWMSIYMHKPHKDKVELSYGYVGIYRPNHPRCNRKDGRVMEHIIVWEETNGRELPEGWVVHHINGNKKDNRIENLTAMPFGQHHSGLITKDLQKRVESLELTIKQLQQRIILLEAQNITLCRQLV